MNLPIKQLDCLGPRPAEGPSRLCSILLASPFGSPTTCDFEVQKRLVLPSRGPARSRASSRVGYLKRCEQSRAYGIRSWPIDRTERSMREALEVLKAERQSSGRWKAENELYCPGLSDRPVLLVKQGLEAAIQSCESSPRLTFDRLRILEVTVVRGHCRS